MDIISAMPIYEFICDACDKESEVLVYALGIDVDRAKTLRTNEFLETAYPNIYACGDVAGPYQFTHTASHQAWYAAVNALFAGLRRYRVDYRVIPWTTFIDPEVARGPELLGPHTAAPASQVDRQHGGLGRGSRGEHRHRRGGSAAGCARRLCRYRPG